jgi:hypothetical protein
MSFPIGEKFYICKDSFGEPEEVGTIVEVVRLLEELHYVLLLNDPDPEGFDDSPSYIVCREGDGFYILPTHYNPHSCRYWSKRAIAAWEQAQHLKTALGIELARLEGLDAFNPATVEEVKRNIRLTLADLGPLPRTL